MRARRVPDEFARPKSSGPHPDCAASRRGDPLSSPPSGRVCYDFDVPGFGDVEVIKVAMIGAGSVVFSKNLTGDILSYPEFRNASFSYMDIDADRLQVGANLCRKVARSLGAEPKIEATQDRRAALAGADFVINMVQI